MRAGLQGLLQKLAEKMNPVRLPRLKWIQATVGTSIQMIPVEDVLFFISDEKYTRVQTRFARGADPKADQGAGGRARRRSVLADPPLDPGQRAAIAGVSRDLRGRQLVAVRGHPEKLEVSRSYAGLFKGM
jgi:hypothetical protein